MVMISLDDKRVIYKQKKGDLVGFYQNVTKD